MNPFRILVADDHAIVRFGLRALLSSHKDWEICGEACDGRETIDKCRRLKPDRLILDICMPKLNGVDAARQILRDDPTQRILVFTNVESEVVVRNCLGVGVRGWIFKSEDTADLVLAVESLQRHKSIFSARVSDLIADTHFKRKPAGSAAHSLPSLTPRERQVVQLVSEGKVSKEISSLLGVSLKTVETHRSNVLRKLKIRTTVELVLYAVRNEIIHVQLPGILRPDALRTSKGMALVEDRGDSSIVSQSRSMAH